MNSGFFDLQVNGYVGIDFSSSGLAREKVGLVADSLEEAGTAMFLPTVVTTLGKNYRENLAVLGAACEADVRLPGIHLEGPFISTEDGAVGAHRKDCVQAPSVDFFKKLQDWAGGHVRLLTLAPEVPGAIKLIEYLVENNVVVSVGHTLAESRHITDACAAGATLATHLGNGIPNQLNRTDNTIWSILASPLAVMLITDGFHLPPDFIRAVYAIKGPGKTIITSDAASVAGLEPGEYEMFATRVRLTEDGCVRNLNAPTLAGSAATMARCAEICRQVLNPAAEDLEKICRDNAAERLGIINKK